MGMTVFSGMLIATLIGVCLVPVLFVAVEKVLQWRRGQEDRPAQAPSPPSTTDAH
jgi:HAE1 family hydrophobic/amphiphilic exporter-1